jgi:hypothetical protein
MADRIPINEFNREVECTFKDERYSVRDNGAVLKHPRIGKQPRPTDNQWTFGKPNDKTGYMEIATVRVHRIVATSFHGVPPTKEHVVDHIDTNKRNNRPENLRWVTRFENVVLNPITAKRIALVCGSVEAFLEEPSKYRDLFPEPNYNWMCTVSKEEAKVSYERMLNWAKRDQVPSGGSIGEWIFNRNKTIPKKTEKERIAEEQNSHLSIDEKVEKVFQKVKRKTGLSREELSLKTKKSKYLKARVYAAKLLRLEIDLSEESISKLIGISKSMVNAYLNHADYYLQNTDYYQEVKGEKSLPYSNNQFIKSEFVKPDIPVTKESLSPNAVQRNWKIPSEFPCCPQKYTEDPIVAYAINLKTGSIFCQNNIW